MKYKIIDSGSSDISLRPNGSDFIYDESSKGINQVAIYLDEEFNTNQGLAIITTDSLGIIEHSQRSNHSNPTVVATHVVPCMDCSASAPAIPKA